MLGIKNYSVPILYIGIVDRMVIESKETLLWKRMNC